MNQHDDSNGDDAPQLPWWRRMLRGIPSLLVLVLLLAVGVYGHRTEWRAPRFAEFMGRTTSPIVEDWCPTHNVPDSRCIACHPELAGESAADWCKEHGVPESKCTICHPEILETGVAADWCREHGLPESSCTICHPEIAQKSELRIESSGIEVDASGAISTVPTPIRDPKTCQTHALKVQFASKESLVKAGIALGAVIERPMAQSIDANAEIDYDRTRLARIASRASGTATAVRATLGERVSRGQVLAWIESPELGAAKAELLLAHAAVAGTKRALERMVTSSSAGFRTETEKIAAEQAAREAEIRRFAAQQELSSYGLGDPGDAPTEETLRALGLPEEMARSTRSANLFPVRAPLDGVIASRELVEGAVVAPDQVLFDVVDPTRMIVHADLLAADAQRVALGQELLFAADDARDHTVNGSVSWISTAIDSRSRTVAVRAEVDNSEGRLRAGAFGRARIVIRKEPQAIAIPNAALQWEGCCHIVFVRLADEIFQTRKVSLGARDSVYTEVIGGVLPGEVVVTNGSHVLKSEILKSNLGAGCCVED